MDQQKTASVYYCRSIQSNVLKSSYHHATKEALEQYINLVLRDLHNQHRIYSYFGFSKETEIQESERTLSADGSQLLSTTPDAP